CAGKSDGTTVGTPTPTADVRVRRAVAAAIDPGVINERVYNGTANATSELFPEPLPWAPGVPGPKYDLDEAKKLVNEAKSVGWDGKIRLRGANTNADVVQAIGTMLELAGMKVEADSS